MQKIRKILLLLFPVLLCSLFFMLSSCEPKVEVPEPSAGSADFSRYVAIGSSYSSGFADGALSRQGQLASFPNLLAQRMQLVGGADTFNIPLLKGNKGTYPDDDYAPGLFDHTLPRYVLVKEPDCKGEVDLMPERLPGRGDNEINLDDPSQRIYSPDVVYQHLGIPAMKLINFTSSGYGDVANYGTPKAFSPYFWRFAPEPLTLSSPYTVEVTAHPTFFTFELGMSDVLAYAIAGGTGKVTGEYDDDISPVNSFNANLNGILDALVNQQGASGVIANIPDITTFPHFTVIEYDALELDSAEVQQMNAMYAPQGLTFTEGDNNPFVIREDGVVRKIKSDEFVLLGVPTDSLKCYDMGSFIPIPDEYVLSEDEIANVKSYTDQFNQALAEVAATYGVPMVDLAGFMDRIHSETTISGIDFSSEFVSGGFFSLDGLHPNDRGQALIANEFLKVINAEYGAKLPLYQIDDFPGVLFP